MPQGDFASGGLGLRRCVGRQCPKR